MSAMNLNSNQAENNSNQVSAYLGRLESELAHHIGVWWFLRDVTSACSNDGLTLSYAGKEGLHHIAKMMADRAEAVLDSAHD